jgi:hypothetical protein
MSEPKPMSAFVFIAILIAVVAGCGETTRTTTVRTERYDDTVYDDRAAYGGYVDRDARVVETEVAENDGDDGGLFDIVGDVVALPFRALDGLLSAVF